MRKKSWKDLDGNKKVSTFAPAFEKHRVLLQIERESIKTLNFFLKSFGSSKKCITFALRFAQKNEPAALKSDKLYQRKSKQNYFTGSCRIVTQKS